MTLLSSNVDSRETEKFGALAASWWDPNGPMHTLHTVNPLRMSFIARSCELRGRTVLDIGCGGGVLAESLAALGARVKGIDLSQDLLGVASLHARQQGLPIEYCYVSAEQLAAEQRETFEIVTCMEVLEHVPRPAELITACSALLRPGGHAFFATIERSPKALLFVIFGAEFILRLLPIGTHNYHGLIRRGELRAWGESCDLDEAGSISMTYNLITRIFRLTEQREPTYIMHFKKRAPRAPEQR